MLEKGEIIDNKFEILEEIGRGGMGRVYKARHISLQNFWAIKETEISSNNKVNLLAEPDILRRLNHINLPKIIDVFKRGNYLYIIEDFIEGVSLNTVLENKHKLDENIIVEWAIQLCGGLHYLHSMKPRPIIYRDLKPSNIMLVKDGTLKLIDFGTSKEDNGELDNMRLGTRGFAAPEQYKGISNERSDIYTFGATLYYLITGSVPARKSLSGKNDELEVIKGLNFDASRAMVHIINKCMEVDPAKRYKNVLEIKNELLHIDDLNGKLTFSKSRFLIRTLISLIVLLGAIGAVRMGYNLYEENKNEKYLKAINESKQYFVEGKYPQMEDRLNEIIQDNPKRLEAYKQLFKLYIYQGRDDEVVNKIIALRSTNTIKPDKEMHYIQGTAYFNQGDYRNAIDAYEEALRLDPKYVEVIKDECVSYARSGDIKKAGEKISQLKVLDSGDVDLYYLDSEIDLMQLQYEDAINNLECAININSTDERFYTLLADIYAKQENFEKEVSTLERGEKAIGSTSIKYQISFGDIYQRQAEKTGDKTFYEKGLKYYLKVKDSGFETAELDVRIGRCYRKLEDFLKAEEFYDSAVKTNEKYIAAYLELGLLYVNKEEKKLTEHKDYSRAIQYLETVINTAPNSTEAKQAAEYIDQLKKGE